MAGGPAEILASHEVLEFVRDKPDLSRQVMLLRNAGKSWLEVKEALRASGEPLGTRSVYTAG